MPNKHPLLSVILPVYNGEETIKATLESLLNQTYPYFELLIGIDGTKDNSKSIAESFQDSRIKIIENQTNLGLADNVNKLISLTSAKSDLIAMAEQDDIYVPERLEWQITIMQERPEVGLVSGITEFIGTNVKIMFPGILVKDKTFPQGKDLFKYLYVNQNKVVNTCMFFRKSVHQSKGLTFKNTYGNFNSDWDYVLRFSLVSQIYGIPKVLVKMNRKKDRQSVTVDKTAQYEASRKLLKDFRKEFPEIISSKTYSDALKTHRKIELGHHSKYRIVLLALYYSFIYNDLYFLKYMINRIPKYSKSNV
ncbi:glycosyltransferase family 2 protein [Formosa maritima]|uniref:Glycosyltransferase n=1 Tax=Formosa maritima TaxID=2592046 RepID=A0A5D0GCN7_9FLAO|nr:glycosyltransferase [Formosa maritima]TYA56655.1 glycosyltransferase [Formosa maritima]